MNQINPSFFNDDLPELPVGPSEETIRVQARVIHGRTFVVLRNSTTSPSTDSMHYRTLQSEYRTETDCGCRARNISDYYGCSTPDCVNNQGYRRVVCGTHIDTCQSCGLLCCSACLVLIPIEEHQAIVCRTCADQLLTPLWKKGLRLLL